jgi:hypothetical protein
VRAGLLSGLTWVPVAGLALLGGSRYVGLRIDGANFFADFAAYAQFLIALPLFVVAEAIVGRATRDAAAEFVCANPGGAICSASRSAACFLQR